MGEENERLWRDAPSGPEKGIKHDQGKLRFDLIPVEALESFVEVLTLGAIKYADHNWRLGLNYSRVYGATQRHLNAFWKGERNDKESNLHHLAHALCELFFLLQFDLENRTELDDRYRNEKANGAHQKEQLEQAKKVLSNYLEEVGMFEKIEKNATT